MNFLIEGRDHEFTGLMADVVGVFKSVYDPEIPVPIWDLGLIYAAEIDEATKHVDVTMTLTAPNCPAAQTLPAEVEQGVNALDGVETAKVTITFTPTFSLEMVSDEAKMTMGMI